MSWREWLRRPRLVAIAEFSDRSVAEEAWGLLEEAGIPASVEGDAGALGSPVLARIYVEKPNVVQAQQVLIELITRGDES